MERDESQTKDLASVVARLAGMVEKLAERVGKACTCAEPVDLPRVWKEELSKAKLTLAKPLTEEQVVEDYPLSQHEIAAVVERAQEKKVKPPLEAEQLRALVLEHLGDNALKDRKAALQQAMMAPMMCGRPFYPKHAREPICAPSTGFEYEFPTCWGPHDQLCMIYRHDCRWIHDCGSPFRCAWPHRCGIPYVCPPSFGRFCGNYPISGPDPCGGLFDPPTGPDWWREPEGWLVQNVARVRQR